MKNILLTIAVSLAATCANATWREGGGGRAVVCRDVLSKKIKAAELLDLYEARTIFGLTPTQAQSTFQEQALWLDTKLNSAKHNFYLSEAVLKSEFLDKVQFLGDDVELTPVDDSFEPAIPKYCSIEQVANYHQSGRILIKKEIWDAFNPKNQVALALHEVAYLQAREWGQPTSSYYVRRFVGLMFSEETLKAYQPNPRFEVNYYCTNTDALLGFNMTYELQVGGSKCKDRPNDFCDGMMTFRTLNGQLVYDSTTLPFSAIDPFLKGLDTTRPLLNFSMSVGLQSQIFEGVSFVYTITDKNSIRTPQVTLNTPGNKRFVDLKCEKK